VLQVVQLQRRITLLNIQAGGHHSVLYRQQGNQGFNSAGCAQRMPGRALGRTARLLLPKTLLDRRIFGPVSLVGVAVPCRLISRCRPPAACIGECAAHRRDPRLPFGWGVLMW